MKKNNSILNAIVLSFLVISCSNNSADKLSHDNNNDTIIVNDTKGTMDTNNLTIVFMSEFNDSLWVELNDSLLVKDFFTTDESIGASRKTVKVPLLNKDVNSLRIKALNLDANFVTSINSTTKNKYLYIWKENDHWRSEFTSNPKNLE